MLVRAGRVRGSGQVGRSLRRGDERGGLLLLAAAVAVGRSLDLRRSLLRRGHGLAVRGALEGRVVHLAFELGKLHSGSLCFCLCWYVFAQSIVN